MTCNPKPSVKKPSVLQGEFIAFLLLEHNIVGEFIDDLLMIDLLQGPNARLIASTAWGAWTSSRKAVVIVLPKAYPYDDGENKSTRDFVYVDELTKVIEDVGLTVVES